jgi:hypothetical protein
MATATTAGAAIVALLAVIMLTTGGAAARVGYPAFPPPAHTGGFGEPTCYACHFDAEPNEPGGTLTLAGVPETYIPGESYTLTAVLSHAEMSNAGYQLAVRLADGPSAGAQAGEIRLIDGRSAVTTSGEPGVQYLHHTETGTAPQAQGIARWSFEWVAPVAGATPDGSGAVVFHLVANAAAGDESPFCDLIYTHAREVPRGAPGL